jgi:hypothetical protein
MSDDEFNELVKRKFAEFERKNGRVPTLQELADNLGIDSRMLARKLRKAIKTLGVDAYTEGTSAFKSTLRDLLSGDILTKGLPGFQDLAMLLREARHNGFAEMRWKADRSQVRLIVNCANSEAPLWIMFGPSGIIFKRLAHELPDIIELLASHARNERIESALISHMSGEPEFIGDGMPLIEYQDPIPEDQLPPNVLPFRKPYQHSDE